MDFDKAATKIALRELLKLDWAVLRDVMRDEIRWGTRGELNEPGSDDLTATFDTKGDAEKFRRLAIRIGYDADPVYKADVTKYEGMDFLVRIRHMN